MGTFLTKLFVDVETLPDDGFGFIQLLFLGGAYAFVLMQGSNMISEGSELLLLIPALAGVVGSIVLPVLGAVPDGAIVIFSGLGPKDMVQKQINVGVGALAGSTIMLLTIPWCLAIWGGRVNLDEAGNGNYVRPKGKKGWAKLMPLDRVKGAGVNCGPMIKYTSKVMLLTLVPFLVIQIPAFVGKCGTKKDADNGKCKTPEVAALIGGIMATLLFVFYLWDQARLANQDPVKEDKIDEIRKKAIAQHVVSLRGLFPQQLMDSQGLITINAENKRFQSFLKPFFRRFDVDNSGSIDRQEFALLMQSLGEKPDKENLDEIMAIVDTDKNGTISFDEFCAAMVKVLNQEPLLPAVAASSDRNVQQGSTSGEREGLLKGSDAEQDAGDDGEDEDEEEEPEMPDDLAHLSPEQQQSKLLKRSFIMMGVGVFLVLLFSDPMVDVLTELGARTHIKPFYVAFVLAPLASNASELIAAYAYALKKTEKTITISFSSLLGAACMNNTFCLCLFLFLVYGRNLEWVFSAETISILAVELVMFFVAQRRVHPTLLGFAVLALFPLSICLVIGLEAAGLD